jgi:acetoin:2,6-dichlorophenolindophenol oxidoreductase subunit beta
MKLTYGNALRQALYDELSSNHSVVLFGEDVQHNLYGYTGGFIDQFGADRIINIPLSEAGVMGTVIGSAMCGLRPILDLTLPNFLYMAMDQIANIAAKTHYLYDGAYSLPLTVFCSSMSGSGNAAQHSDRLHSLFMNIPGLKIICPASPQDMYSMLREAIEDDNPVLCFADRSLFWREEEISTELTHTIGHANKVNEGDDITIVTVSSCLQMVKDILPILIEKGISPDIIDIRSVNPLDFNTIKKSVEKTGKVIICDTANKTGSTASEISSLLSQYAFEFLKAPIQIVACEDVPIPFAKVLEQEILVTKEKILNRIISSFEFN